MERNDSMANIFKSAIMRTSRHRPAPSMFFLPGLETKPWWDPESSVFGPWIDNLRSNLATIRDEYNNVSQHESDYEVQSEHEKLHSGDWEWHSFIQKGSKNDVFRKSCPRTAEILESIPSLMTKIPFAYAFFSTLHGESKIAAHTGPCNLRLRVHFPILVPNEINEEFRESKIEGSDNGPPACGMSVGGVAREWEEGVPAIFDDAFVHHTWNNVPETKRVVLLFDIWHPGVHPDEREEIVGMFEGARQKGWLK